MNIHPPLQWRQEWTDKILGGYLGLAVGDALGLPWEGEPKWRVQSLWSGEMTGGGAWGQPPGTWSDDTGQTLAVTHGLARGGVEAVAEELVKWFQGIDHTLEGRPLGMGLTTRIALGRISSGSSPLESGVDRPSCGSLMRNLPVAYYTLCMPLDSALEMAHGVSRITHANSVAEMACGLHTVIVRGLMAGLGLDDAIWEAGRVIQLYYMDHPRYKSAAPQFLYLVDTECLRSEPGEGSCLASETLRGALWALLTSSSYREAVARAVSLGGDTDTLGAVAGGVAGTIYGATSIPGEWLARLRGREMVERAAYAMIGAVKRVCGAR